MSKRKHEYKQIKITDLLLNPSNPRLNPVQHQVESIEAMVEDQGEKLIELAKHIVQNGLNPIDIILIRPQGNQWLVCEGNRRVTALKLINEPDLVPSKYSKLKKQFQRLNTLLDNALLENIPCVVIDDPNSANEWIRLKHTGENQGAGTVRWNSQQTSRFSYQVTSSADSRAVFLDKLKEMDEIPEDYKKQFVNIKKTNFDRLIGDPDVRKLVGVDNIDGRYELPNGVNQYLLEILHDLAFTDFNVGDIYRKEDRRKYLDSINERVTQGSSNLHAIQSDKKEDGVACPVDKTTNALSSTNSISQKTDFESRQSSNARADENGQTTTPKKSKGKSYPVNRKVLVPAQHKLVISHGRIVRIFNELKTLEVEEYPNAVATLFRVFIELSTDFYLMKNKIPSVNEDTFLSKKIEAVANDLESNNILSKHQLRAARQMASSNTQNASVKTFHSYVHNKDVTPSATDLKSAWDDLWLFIESLWRESI